MVRVGDLLKIQNKELQSTAVKMRMCAEESGNAEEKSRDEAEKKEVTLLQHQEIQPSRSELTCPSF